MATALKYVVQPGDSYWQIAEGLAAAQGVTAEQIMAANPDAPADSLKAGQVLAVPAASGDATALRYTVRPGDSYWALAEGLKAAAGVTADDIAAANPGISPEGLMAGQVIAIPSGAPAPTPEPVPAENIGYWRRTWLSCTPPAGATFGAAFSGWNLVDNALIQSSAVRDQLVGTRYITIGGGDKNTGAFDASVLASVNAAIGDGRFAGYQGIAYDVEEGAAGLAEAFAQSFAAAKAAGFQVLVTVSHSAPYGIADAADLMESFFADDNIDFLSPQLYTQGNESANDWATSAGVGWDRWASAKAAVVPSVVTASLYPDAEATLKTFGVTTRGYVVWNC